MIESSVLGSLMTTLFVGAALIAEFAHDAERLGQAPGPGLLVLFVFGAVLGLVPGALLGLLLGVGLLLLLRTATVLFGRGRARGLAVGFSVLATAALLSVGIGGDGVWAQVFLVVIWTTAGCVLVRMRRLAREPETVGVDEATAARLRRAFDQAP